VESQASIVSGEESNWMWSRGTENKSEAMRLTCSGTVAVNGALHP
jgi:hypothetical protein